MPQLQTMFSALSDVRVIDKSIPLSQYTAIDLSVSNADLTKIDLRNPQDFETFIETHLLKNKAKIAFGGYNEERNLYDTKKLFDDEQSEK